MYTKFIRNFNSFFGKKGNRIFSLILIIFSILMLACSTYAFYSLCKRNNKFVIKYVSFKDDKGYFIDSSGETEVTFLSYADGSALNPSKYNNQILKMYCLKNGIKNCYYIEKEYTFEYISFGFISAILILSLGLVFRKLYKIRNINYGTIKAFRPFFIVLFVFGIYLFSIQTYNLLNYIIFNCQTSKVNGTIIGTYKDNYLVEYEVNNIHYSNIVKIPDKSKQTTITVKYNTKKPSMTYFKNKTNYLILILGIYISYKSLQVIRKEQEIDKKIKVIEKKQKKDNYRRKKWNFLKH